MDKLNKKRKTSKIISVRLSDSSHNAWRFLRVVDNGGIADLFISVMFYPFQCTDV